jgi:hypothetical protein
MKKSEVEHYEDQLEAVVKSRRSADYGGGPRIMAEVHRLRRRLRGIGGGSCRIGEGFCGIG